MLEKIKSTSNQLKFCLIIPLVLALSVTFFACDYHSDDQSDEKAEVKVESWPSSLLKSDATSVEYDYYFESVDDLRDAIKHDPDKYNGKKVKVIGTLHEPLRTSAIFLVDYTLSSTDKITQCNLSDNTLTGDELSIKYDFIQTLDISTKVHIIITNEAQKAVIEEGDFIKLYGTIVIDSSGIRIEDCEYKLIATLEERIERVK